MGRKPKTLTTEQMAQVEALAAYLSQDQIADYFGTTRTTFAAMIERDAEISVRYKRGKAKAIGTVAHGLLQKARNGDTTSAIFYLKTQAGWRETSNVDHKVDVQTGGGAAKLAAVIEAIAERSGTTGPDDA